MFDWSTIKAVSFDGDETLWNFQTAMREALQKAVDTMRSEGLRRPDGDVSVEWLIEVRERLAALPKYGRTTMEGIRRAAFREAVAQCGGDIESADRLCDRYFDDRLSGQRLYDRTIETLESLAHNYSLALVTNGNTRPESMGLGERFDVVVTAAESGFVKPDSRIFGVAIERLDVAPENCVHIGDHPVEDVAAAQNAGLRTIWLNRSGGESDVNIKPDAEIGRLPDLLSL
ncbi:HAD family hydrolase [Haloglycomyces albus]|uniref:HAD family hydrolase n=1 Tax=Haloglycomyces albus TaxID=526067 RepID=UPI00046CDAEF|nr:HAD family hydrolase [Haloglycomyces albus]